MDFEFTSRPSSTTKPVWATSGQDPQTPRKRTFTDVNPSTPIFPGTPGTPSWPTFGQHNNVPFLFKEPVPQTPHSPAWAPPPSFSPEKAFPQPEIKDVDMAEGVSPEKEKEKEAEGERSLAVGALRRVFKKRKARERSQLGRRHARVDDGESTAEESGEEEGEYGAVTRKTTNHYTLNLAGAAPPPSDLPYRLLGYVQVLFNASLALIFLYLLVQFIFTVQHDVEHRVAEYSMDAVQEIAQCALHYKTNLCAKNAVPAMAHQCATWETCMNRDPTRIGRARISLEVLGEVLNSFVEPISWKALMFTVVSLGVFTVFINSLLSLYRSRINPATHLPTPPVPPYPIAPAVPFPGPHGYLPPAHGWGAKGWKHGDDETEELAPRRRRLEDGQAAKIK
ncbi:Di-sulfide bridge nucleocytoplasmic transport domain-containing protein [Trametes polyzona]|nr:Di-sulfide bridge nucleocytoplasmic transport domain-containing protein [Trametes polyzona]